MKQRIKKIIGDWLIKYIDNHRSNLKKNYARYILVRLIAELITDKWVNKNLVWDVASFHYNHAFFQKYPHLMTFTDMFVVNNRLFLFLERPGIWIGKGGTDIDALQRFINSDIDGNKVSDYKISILEDCCSTHAMYSSWFKVQDL